MSRRARWVAGLRVSLMVALLASSAKVLAQPASVAPAVATAVASAGMVKRLAGTVSLQRAGGNVPVTAGTTVLVGDTLRTGPDGAVGITLADDTLLAVGPDSELVLSEFAFNTTTQDGNMLASLWRGTLSVVTGLIGRKTPDNVRVQTRTVVLGVRGTEFIVDAKGVQK